MVPSGKPNPISNTGDHRRQGIDRTRQETLKIEVVMARYVISGENKSLSTREICNDLYHSTSINSSILQKMSV